MLDIPLPPGAGDSDARLAVLFSGGLDCTVLARVASEILPSGQPIDLINVAFENPRIASQHPDHSKEQLYELCPDRITGRKAFGELLETCPSRPWRFVTVCSPIPLGDFRMANLGLGKCSLHGHHCSPGGSRSPDISTQHRNGPFYWQRSLFCCKGPGVRPSGRGLGPPAVSNHSPGAVIRPRR